MLTVCTWLWGDKYSPDYVEKLRNGVQRHLKAPHRFLCITERDRIANFSTGIERHAIKDMELLGRGCFARLRMFDPAWQARCGIDDRLVSIDVDTVVTGQIDPLFDRPESFLILQGGNASNPCPYNGALVMLKAGAHPEVWSDFSLDAAAKVPFHEFPDDQGWLWHKLPNAAGWKTGPESGAYVFRKPGWMSDTDDLPKNARLVTFIGKKNPVGLMHLDWVRECWR